MDKLIEILGHVGAIVGIALCLLGGLQRVISGYFIGSYEANTVFSAGIAFMVFACLAKVHLLGKKG